MLIALLALLGVDVVVVVGLLGAVFARRRWVAKQPGVFKGSIRTTRGTVPGLGAKWSRGYGRWVHDVLVWTTAPFLVRNVFLASDSVVAKRPIRPGEVKGLGEEPVVLSLRAADATVEVAVPSDQLACCSAHTST